MNMLTVENVLKSVRLETVSKKGSEKCSKSFVRFEVLKKVLKKFAKVLMDF